jgi:hypothetical protein
MKKSILVLILLLILVAVLPVQAQDDMTSCTPEEFVDATTEVSENVAEFLELLQMADETDASDVTAAVVLLDAYSYGFWEGFYEASEEGLCIELEWFGYNGGLVLDDLLITAQLSALALHEADAGNTELATALAEYAMSRSEMIDVSATYVDEVSTSIAEGNGLTIEYVECTAEELDTTNAGLEEIAATYLEFGELTLEAEGEDLSTLIVGYAALSDGFWKDFMPVVPMCFEAQESAFTAGLIIDESLIIVSSLRLAEIEAEMGDEDIATVLADSASVRLDDLLAILEEME